MTGKEPHTIIIDELEIDTSYLNTSHDLDAMFKEQCTQGSIDFTNAMWFFRLHNPPGFRADMIKEYVPKKIEKQVEIQCKLEGLI